MADNTHWLYRKESIPKLWKWGIAILVLTVAAEFIWPVHSHFALADWPAFSAIYGFAACAVLVIGAKWLGLLVKRPEHYYDHPSATESSDES